MLVISEKKYPQIKLNFNIIIERGAVDIDLTIILIKLNNRTSGNERAIESNIEAKHP